ncbi:uncharacterized protein VTP21DRAFT_6325 [Calcarisporiella thermophila]|uniref:uncharacterized protein n=1 Tax=Calcarisporiella thermophila TaxID=911321 RepID=UPI0037447103
MESSRCALLMVDNSCTDTIYLQRRVQGVKRELEWMLEEFTEVVLVPSNDAAMKFLEQRPRVGVLPVIALIDVDISGVELLVMIASKLVNGMLHDVVPVACSKNDSPNFMLQCINMGAADYLLKPLSRETIKTLFLNMYKYRVSDHLLGLPACTIRAQPNSKSQTCPRLRDRLKEVLIRDRWLGNFLMEYFCPPIASVDLGYPRLNSTATEERNLILKSRLCSWNFCTQDLSEEDLLRCVCLIFEQVLSLEECPYKNQERLHRFVLALRNSYHHTNPYHNFMHAVDVLQATYYFLVQMKLLQPLAQGDTQPISRIPFSISLQRESQVQRLFRHVDILALLLASIGHDIGHPGLSNMFLSNLSCPLALLYNDKSILENFHSMALFQLMKKHHFCYSDEPNDKEYTGFRKLIVNSILATDMALHWDYITKLKDHLDRLINHDVLNYDPQLMEQDRLLICGILIKCADISNCARPFQIAEQWSKVLIEEFTCQGDLEKELHLPVLYMNDRDKVTAADSQIGFISNLALPLFEVVANLIPEMGYCVDYLFSNKKAWEDRKYLSQDKEIASVSLIQQDKVQIESSPKPDRAWNLETSSGSDVEDEDEPPEMTRWYDAVEHLVEATSPPLFPRASASMTPYLTLIGVREGRRGSLPANLNLRQNCADNDTNKSQEHERVFRPYLRPFEGSLTQRRRSTPTIISAWSSNRDVFVENLRMGGTTCAGRS